jgi:3-hydroxy-5-methyl-1-naphthoate 3-O-methyltransferase
MSETQTKLTPLPLMKTITGLWAARTLGVALDIGVFALADRPDGVSVSELASLAEIASRPAELLLTACAGLDLLETNDGNRYRNTPLAQTYLVRGKPRYFGGVIQHFDKHSAPGWMQLEKALKTDRPTTWNTKTQKSLFDNLDKVYIKLFWDGMYSLSVSTADVVADNVDFSSTHRLLDVGGGGGAYDIVLCHRYPHLTATIYDLPQACAFTENKIRDAGLDNRITLHRGNFFTDAELPSGHDTILLSMIMHDWAEPDCRVILGKCAKALPPGGRLIISELLVDDAKDGPLDAALMNIHMLVETPGQNYTGATYSAWLADAGFIDIHTIRFEAPSANGVVIATRP